MSSAISVRCTRSSLVLLVWLAAASLALAQADRSPPPRLERLIARYSKLVDAGELERAARLADRAAAEFPHSAAAGLMGRHSRLLAAGSPAENGLQPISRDLEGQRYTVVYAVADLVVPVPPAVIAAESVQAVPVSAQADFDSLIEKITAAVLPGSWESAGGAAHIAPVEQNLSLVITQTAEGHEEIADLLEQLRRHHDVQIVLEARWLSLPVDGLPEGVTLPALQESLILGPERFRAVMEMAQSDRRGSILQAPKVTLLNGQSGEIATSDCDPGWMRLQPVVSDDHRTIRLAVSYGRKPDGVITSLASTVPLDAALVVGYKEWASEGLNEKECGVPMVSSVPYLNRMFRNVGRGRLSYRLVLAITPRLIVQEEEEERLGLLE